MTYQKVTHGYVVQTFDDKGLFISQEFHADHGENEYLNSENDEIESKDMPLKGQEYFPFNMEQ